MKTTATVAHGALPPRSAASATTPDRATAQSATGDHGTAPSSNAVGQTLTKLQSMGSKMAPPYGSNAAAAGAAMVAMPAMRVQNPFERIQALLRELMQAIQQLIQPTPPYPPYLPPTGGCRHGLDLPPGPPPTTAGPIDPAQLEPPTTASRPQVGAVLGQTAADKRSSGSAITVTSVHGTYSSQSEAVAAAKHLSGVHGNQPFGVVSNGAFGSVQYSVVGLASIAPLVESQSDGIAGTIANGWGLDTIAYSAQTAKHIPHGRPNL